MKNLFNTIQISKPKRNTFDLTHDVKMTGRMGNLMPVMTMECVPGDSVTLGADALLRFAPIIAPVMHHMDLTLHYFFVPNRLVWDNWEDFITNKPTGGLPYIVIDGTETAAQQKFLDYLGIPPNASGSAQPINAIPAAAYQCVYNEYYRDQNLIAEIPYKLSDGLNSKTNLCVLRKRAFEHDYFTACLPTAQQGASVEIPLGSVELDPAWSGTPTFELSGGVAPTGNIEQNAGQIEITGSGQKMAYNPDGSLIVGPTTINDFRRAMKLQEWLEKNMRGGKRYIEQILAHFGVKSSDKRLQRPEYITGVKSPVVVSEVLNSTGEVGGLPQGNMAGHAVSVAQGYNGSYYAEEHGYIIGIMSIMPKPAYSQGIPRTFLKNDPLDWYWPSFANIGEQEVVEAEIYAYTATPNNLFGYIPRYSEYKYMPPRVAGNFRNTLNYWHLGREFGTPPTLSQQFVECDPDLFTRIFAVQDGTDELYIHVLNKVKAVRPMPVFGTPML